MKNKGKKKQNYWRHPKKLVRKLLTGSDGDSRAAFAPATSRRVLFINHKTKLCGVYQFGRRIGEVLAKSGQYEFIYGEVSAADEFHSLYRQVSPAAIIWNYHGLTAPWVTAKLLRKLPTPNICIIHEVNQQLVDDATSEMFDHFLAPDPTLFLKNPLVNKSGRLVPPYENRFPMPPVPVIGSFGFGLQGKGFDRLIAQVQEEFEEATIRLHIPFSEFCDKDGKQAGIIAETCRALVWNPKIKLEITHHYLTDEQLLDFLAQNSLNAFLYDNYAGRGISSVTDYALAVNRPIALTSSAMFRHLHNCTPSLMLEQRSLKEILSTDLRVYAPYRQDWSAENLRWDYERLIDQVLKNIRANSPSFNSIWSHVGNNNASAPAVSPMPVYRPAPLAAGAPLNRILGAKAREAYTPAIAQLFILAPDLMYRKIPAANIQQAFILDTVYRLVPQPLESKILCVGSYEDSAAWSLRRLGFPIEEIDPVINYDLDTFMHKPSTVPASYDVIFSTSVLEHVSDDGLFIRQVARMLKPGGTAVLTCDFKQGFKPGDPHPPEDERFYTPEDFIDRLLPQIDNCHLAGKPEWTGEPNDFQYGVHAYSFATFVFRKNMVAPRI